jgi:hypothetical protein
VLSGPRIVAGRKPPEVSTRRTRVTANTHPRAAFQLVPAVAAFAHALRDILSIAG